MRIVARSEVFQPCPYNGERCRAEKTVIVASTRTRTPSDQRGRQSCDRHSSACVYLDPLETWAPIPHSACPVCYCAYTCITAGPWGHG